MLRDGQRSRAAFVRAALIAVVAALVAIAGVVAWWWMDQRATQRAEVAAATRDALEEVARRLEVLELQTRAGADAAASLAQTLQDHLTVAERSDEELAVDRENQQATLNDAGSQLRRFAAAPAPSPTPPADPEEVAPAVARLEELRRNATALAERFTSLTAAAERWAAALQNLRAAADRYVQTVDEQPDTSDPGRLREQWEQELEVLRDYRQAAEQAAAVEGLEPLARAYLDYVERNMAFAEEAINLLRDDQIETYNQRLQEVFAEQDDPFGFQAAVAEATGGVLDSGVLADLRAVATEASELADEMAAAERAIRSPTTPGQPSGTSRGRSSFKPRPAG